MTVCCFKICMVFAMAALFSLGGVEGRGGSLNCLECNIFFFGVGVPCTEPRNRSGCSVCVKQTAWSYMRHYKALKIQSEAIIETKYCLEDEDGRYSSRMGCDVLLGDSSYVEQCFCNHADFCNSGRHQSHFNIFLTFIPALRLIWNL